MKVIMNEDEDFGKSFRDSIKELIEYYNNGDAEAAYTIGIIKINTGNKQCALEYFKVAKERNHPEAQGMIDQINNGIPYSTIPGLNNTDR